MTPGTVLTLSKVFFDIALLRQPPYRLPASHFLLGVALLAHWGMGIALGLFSVPVQEAAASAIVGTLVMVAIVQGFLATRGLSRRFVQTASALAGAELIVAIAAVPVAYLFHMGGGAAVAGLLSIVLLLWNIAIAAHVFRHALDLTTGPAIGVGLLYLFVSYLVSGLVTA